MRAGWRWWVAAGAALATAGVSACTAAAPPLDVPTPAEFRANPSVEERLRRDIRDLITDKAVEQAQWSVVIQSLKTGDTLYSLNSFRLQVPASNQKLLTAAVAADRLGWDFRYTTNIFAAGPIDEGTLRGDLVVVADGDPTINPRHPQHWGAFDDWAQQIAEQGVRHITGRLIGDDNAFEEPGWGLGWSWDDLAEGYGAPVGALQYNENEVDITVSPGDAMGAPAIIGISPERNGLAVDRAVVTVSAGPSRVLIARVPGSARLRVSGQIAVGAAPVVRYAGVDNPTLMYVNALRDALVRHGIVVDGPAVDIDDVPSPPSTEGARRLVEDHSPKLSEIIDVTLKWSRNQYAETLLRTLARPAPQASDTAALDILRKTLRTWGIFPEQYLARDGSGLSRYDWITGNAVVWLLTYIQLDPNLADTFKGALPVAGVSGNLANRMKGTPAEGRVWAKTGSMSQVRALSGYLKTQQGETMVFSFIVNGFVVPGTYIDDIMDKALVKLVEFERVAGKPRGQK